MASRGLGTLTLDLVMRLAGFEKGLDKAGRTLDKRLRDMDRRAKALGNAIGISLGIGITAALAGTVASLKGAIDNMDKLRDASIRLGIGVETLSAFQFAAQQTGTDIDSLGKGFKLLAKNMADALNPDSGKAQIFEALGIQVADATGKLKSFEQIIPEIADRFKQLEDGPTKAALALELFGKSGLELTEFLNQGGQGIKDLVDRARELGIVISQDAANSADQFKDKLGELKAVAAGLTIQVAEKLLPKLNELVDWAVDFARDGSNAAKVADNLASAFDVLGTAAGVVWKVMQTVGATVRGVTSDVTAAVLVIRALHAAQTLQFEDSANLLAQARLARGMAAEQSQAIADIWSAAAGPKKGPDFSAVSGAFSGDKAPGIDRNQLNRALGGVKDKAPKKKAGGKSDAEKEAEQLAEAYKRTNEQLQQQIALFGQDGEAAKLRYELENGELAKLDPLKKQELLGRAQTLDLMREEEEMAKKIAEQDKREAEEKLRGIEATDKLISDMEFELTLLQMTSKERERAIALRYADANATDAQRAKIAELSDQYHEAAKQAEFWGEVQRGLSDAFYDLATGAASLKDVVKSFFDTLAQYITRMIAEQWAEKIAKTFQSSSSSGGSGGSGFNWGALVGALFGGGKAYGGPVQAGKFYRVNENGPEMLSVGGSDYLMMGNNNGRITPNVRNSSNSLVINNHFSQRPDKRTLEQVSRDMGRDARRGMARTG